MKSSDRGAYVMKNLQEGQVEKSIIRTDRVDFYTFSKFGVTADKIKTEDRACKTIKSITAGMNEKTIIKEARDHYSTIHPTQKPVRLLERLLALVIPCDKNKEDIIVFDPFGGSFSTMEAVYNIGMQGISCEIDEEYFLKGKERIENLPPRQTALFD